MPAFKESKGKALIRVQMVNRASRFELKYHLIYLDCWKNKDANRFLMSNSRCYKVLWSGAYASAARMLPEMRCSMKPMTGSAASALTIRPTTTFGICAGARLRSSRNYRQLLKRDHTASAPLSGSGERMEYQGEGWESRGLACPGFSGAQGHVPGSDRR
jgi:hypothetical protein